jgi:uncharacterized protein (DUF58 family)
MAVGPYGALLEAVRGVRWPARRPVAGGAPGAHLARTRAVASEFVEYRPYRQGDDPRRLDWKLLARSDRAFIRLAPDRSVLGTTIAVDASASMAFPSATSAKWLAARRIAVAAAAVAHAEGDPVGLVVAGPGGVARLAARTRRGVVAEIARTIDVMVPGGSTSLAAAFTGASARVLLITDCLGDLDGIRAAARAHVAAGGEMHVAHIVSRAELAPPRGAILATDPEDVRVARPLTEATRDAYIAQFDAWRASVSRGWRDDGVAYNEVVDDEAAEVVMRRLVALPRGVAARA